MPVTHSTVRSMSGTTRRDRSAASTAAATPPAIDTPTIPGTPASRSAPASSSG
ncbi:hypothetical protein BH24ACT3_BH24ACT3_02670 [soil metagenome]